MRRITFEFSSTQSSVLNLEMNLKWGFSFSNISQAFCLKKYKLLPPTDPIFCLVKII